MQQLLGCVEVELPRGIEFREEVEPVEAGVGLGGFGGG